MTLCQFSIFPSFYQFSTNTSNTPDITWHSGHASHPQWLQHLRSSVAHQGWCPYVSAEVPRERKPRGNPERDANIGIYLLMILLMVSIWYQISNINIIIFWICLIILIPFSTMWIHFKYHHADGSDDGTFFATWSDKHAWRIGTSPKGLHIFFKAIWRVVLKEWA